MGRNMILMLYATAESKHARFAHSTEQRALIVICILLE
jgi:hypothetical protein